MRFLDRLWHVVRALLLGVAAVVIFIEEWGWRPLTALVSRITRWPPLARLEARIAAAPPRVALALFMVPAVALFPVKIGALWLIEQGRVTLGVTLILVAKVLGTALVGRLFLLVEPQLMRFSWFARGLAWWRATKERVMAIVRGSGWWLRVGEMRRAWRRWLDRRIGSGPSSPPP